MNKILVITTEGCEACNIANNNVDIAILQTRIDIEKDTKDFSLVSRTLLMAQKIEDFPTVLYFINDKVVHKAIGTYPSAVYLRWIDMYF